MHVRTVGSGLIAEVGVLHFAEGLSDGRDPFIEDPNLLGQNASFRDFARGGTRVQLTLTFLVGDRAEPASQHD